MSHGKPAAACVQIAITKLTEAEFWLHEGYDAAKLNGGTDPTLVDLMMDTDKITRALVGWIKDNAPPKK